MEGCVCGRERREVVGEKCVGPDRGSDWCGGLDGNDAAEAVGGAEIVLGGPWMRLNCLT
jgi:hypothetical protein